MSDIEIYNLKKKIKHNIDLTAFCNDEMCEKIELENKEYRKRIDELENKNK